MKDIELLYDLIPKHPGVYISIFEDENYECVESLASFCKEIDATLHVKNLSGKTYDKSLHVDEFKFAQPRYNNHAVQYDFVFMCADIGKIDDVLAIANKTYRILKNAGHLFLLCKKSLTCKLSNTLEASNFVALNTIELNSEFDIISAKKMHGWMRV